jgi:hypothetical protein
VSNVDVLEMLVSEASGGDEGAITEVIRPAAIIPEDSARLIMMELALRDVRNGGLWLAEPALWRRFDRPFEGAAAASSNLIGSLQVAYGTPTRYDITVFRVTVTGYGAEHGWTVASLCDEALHYGHLTLSECPRAQLSPPPQPFRFTG